MTGHCTRIGAEALRTGLGEAVGRWLPGWSGRLSPHVLRHYCASHLYEQGMTLKAIQELLGHSWLSTTTQYIHVKSNHIETSWAESTERTLARLGATSRMSDQSNSSTSDNARKNEEV